MDEGLPMYGRYIHEASGKTKIMSYGSHGEVITIISIYCQRQST